MPSHKAVPVRVAIVGLGRAGWNIHALTIQQRKDFVLVGAIDPDAERRAEAEKTFRGCRTYDGWKAFLKDPGQAELVIVATASHQHSSMSIEALKAGLHVLCEKPLGLNLREADRAISVAQQCRRILTVHQNWRTQAHLHHLIALMNSGLLGRVFEIKLTQHAFKRRNDWQTLRKYGGGMLNNHGPHMVDWGLQVLQSEVQDVWGDLQQTVSAGDCEDHFKILLRGKNGRVVDIEVSTGSAFPQRRWLVLGTLGTLQSSEDGESFEVKYLDPKKLKPLVADDTLRVPGRSYGVIGGDALKFKEKTLPANPKKYAVDFYGELYRSIREGKSAWVTPESVREQLRVMELARKATPFR